MVKRGLFIVFEGIDGSGKSTHIGLLKKTLEHRGYHVTRTSEPSKGRIGRFIREYVERREHRLPPEVETLLFAADRFEHLRQVIHPALEEGKIVISDRYLHSSLTYQGAEGINLEWIREINRFVLKPDLCILLDIPPGTSLKRMRGRRRTVFETCSFQEKIRNLYLHLAGEGEMITVDANRPVNEVQEEVTQRVNQLLRPE